MTNKTRRNSRSQKLNMKWMAGSVSLLLISAALESFAEHAPADTGAGTMILAVFLAFWSSVLGAVGVFASALWWLVGWLGGQAKDAASVASRSPKESVDETKPKSFTRVA
ncbi:MAG: hypothetical protein AB1555_10555 [Nitrospirota bacterium]